MIHLYYYHNNQKNTFEGTIGTLNPQSTKSSKIREKKKQLCHYQLWAASGPDKPSQLMG